MNKKNLSLKIDEFTIHLHLHRGQEESEKMKQKRMALYATWLTNVARKQMVKYFEEYCPELQIDVENIIRKHISKNINF